MELWLEYDARRVRVSIHTTGIFSPTRTLRAAGSLQGVPPSCCGRRAAGVGCPIWLGDGTTGKQPANLGVEAAEESLPILCDYAPTVRPPPKRC